MCTTAAIIVFTTSYALGETYDQVPAQIHDFAVAACAPESARGLLPRSHYGAIEDACVYRLSHSPITRDQAIARTTDSRQQFASK
jgi:hypothetical protein